MLETALHQIRIVLVEPAGPLNIGSIARVMKNMGLTRLVLVHPQCDPLGMEARQMAMHGVDVLEAAWRVDTLLEALQGCQRAIATIGRDRTTLGIPLEEPRSALPWLLAQSGDRPPASAALIFGREDRGLTNEELNHAQRFIRIPANAAYLSLNLAQAVAICCYELFMAANLAATSPSTTSASSCESDESALDESAADESVLPTNSDREGLNKQQHLLAIPFEVQDLATLDDLERYYQQLESLLLRVGYLYPHTAASRMEKFRRLFNRAYLSSGEVAMLRGILSQVEWALRRC